MEKGKELAVIGNGNTAIQQWEKIEKELTPEVIRQRLCPDADDTDLFIFIHHCNAHHLNPFIGDVYLIKYSKKDPASTVTGVGTFLKRADTFPQYDGMESGVIVRKGSQLIYKKGAFYEKEEGEFLKGGWCDVFRKDRKIPFHTEVTMGEYEGKKYDWATKKWVVNKMWKSKPATMIVKVPQGQSLRKAFPNEFDKMYLPEEMETEGQELSKRVEESNQVLSGKRNVIDIQPVKEEKTAEIGKNDTAIGKGKVEPTLKKPAKKTVAKKTVKKEEKPVPKKREEILDEKRAKLKGLIEEIPVDDLEEKADLIKIFQEKLEIPTEKEIKDFDTKEINLMVEIIEKQLYEYVDVPQKGLSDKEEFVNEELGGTLPPKEDDEIPPGDDDNEEEKEEETEPVEVGGNKCEHKGCGHYVSKKVMKFSHEKFNGHTFCFQCQKIVEEEEWQN